MSNDKKVLYQNALENGDEIQVIINVSKTIHKSLINYYFDEDETSGIENKIEENQELGTYYYIEIEVLVNGYIVGYISKLDTPAQVTVPLSNGLTKVADGYQRVWKIIRKHEGTIDVLDAKQTENGVSFENSEFSAFALVYEDTKLTETEEENAEENAKEIEEMKENGIPSEALNNPETGDNILIWVFLIVFSALGIVETIIISKRK